MSRIDSIKDQLLAERDQLETDLAKVNALLAVIGGEKKAATPAKSKSTKQVRKQSPPSQHAMETTLKAVNDADRPLRSRELSEITGLSPSLTSKATAYLYKEGRIRGPEGEGGVGYAPGKGKIPLWASLTQATNGGEPEAEPTSEEQPQQEELPVG